MRIIKTYDRIAEEMYNIEAGAETYRDGVRLASPVPGYPRFTVDNVEYRVKATIGYVYYSGGKLAFDALRQRLEILGDESHLSGYVVIRSGECVSVKAKIHPRYAKRVIYDHEPFESETLETRFSWVVLPIERFQYTLDTGSKLAVNRYVCSAFYDPIGICRLEDGVSTIDFSRECLVGWSNYTRDEITLSTYLNPIAFELNRYWSQSMPTGASVLEIHRNVPESKVYIGDYANIAIEPVQTDHGMQTDVCSKCLQPLYDDIYVLTMPVKKPDRKTGTAICPLCLHMCEKRLEMRYMYVFVVKHPRSRFDVIESLAATPEHKALLRAAAGGMRPKKFSDNKYTYYDIGDYIAVSDIDHYLCSKDSTVCTKKVVLLATPDKSDWILD